MIVLRVARDTRALSFAVAGGGAPSFLTIRALCCTAGHQERVSDQAWLDVHDLAPHVDNGLQAIAAATDSLFTAHAERVKSVVLSLPVRACVPVNRAVLDSVQWSANATCTSATARNALSC